MIKINKLYESGFFHVCFSSGMTKVLTFSSFIFYSRFLSVSDFGLYSFAISVISYIYVFASLGLISSILQFVAQTKSKEEQNLYFFLGIKVSVFFNLILGFSLILISFFIDIKVIDILKWMAFFPLFYISINAILIFFRANFRIKEFAQYNLLYASLLISSGILGCYLFQITGLIFSFYLSSFIVILLLYFNIRNIKKPSTFLNLEQKREFFKFSFICLLNNGMSQALYYIDIIFIGIFLTNIDEVAVYRIASIIPFALVFLPMTLVSYYYPYFARKYNDINWVKKNVILLLVGSSIVFLPLGIILNFLADWMIPFLFGNQYVDSIYPFKILIWGFVLAACLRVPLVNINVACRNEKINLIIGFVSLIANVVSCYIFIPKFGVLGASYSYFFIVLLSSFILFVFFCSFLKNKSKVIENYIKV